VVGVLLGGFGLLVVVAVAFRPVVEGDGVGYFSYLHAALVRHSLDLRPEYAAASAAGVNTDPAMLEAPTATGRPANFFPIGPALLAAPAYAAALVLGGAGQPPYAPPLVGAFALTSLLAGLLTLLLCWRLTGSVVAVAATALGTPYAFYLLLEPSYSHMFSAFAATAFVLAWWRGRDARTPAGWLGLGALAGLMAIVRWQDAALAAVALLTPPPAGRRRQLLLMLPGALVAVAPQLAVDRVIFGTWLPQRPPGQALDPLAGHQLQVLMSSWHGLFVWHPITALAAASALLVRDRRLRAACLYALVIETLIDGAAPDWWGGAAFGARRFLDLAPFWAIGLAALAARLPAGLAWAGTGALAAWNLLLVANLQYVTGGDRDPGYAGLLANQAAAVHSLPHLAVQGVVVRDLFLGPTLGGQPDPLGALAWLAAEAACVAVVLALVLRWRVPPPAAAAVRTPAPSPAPVSLPRF
jgi:hypothetical protein